MTCFQHNSKLTWIIQSNFYQNQFSFKTCIAILVIAKLSTVMTTRSLSKVHWNTVDLKVIKGLFIMPTIGCNHNRTERVMIIPWKIWNRCGFYSSSTQSVNFQSKFLPRKIRIIIFRVIRTTVSHSETNFVLSKAINRAGKKVGTKERFSQSDIARLLSCHLRDFKKRS